MKESTFLSVVVYVRNEAAELARFMPALDVFLSEEFEMAEIIVVDDASADRPGEVLHRLAPGLTCSATMLRLARPHGIEAGVIAGLERSVGDFVVEMESPSVDFPLKLLHELNVQSAAGHDIVAATAGTTPLRSRLFYGLVNRYSDLGIELTSESVRIVSRRALNAMLALQEKVRYRKVLYELTGFPSTRVRYTSMRAVRPVRSISRETFALAFDILLSFSNFGLRVAHYLSLAFAVLCAISIVYTLAVFLFTESVVEGWTTTMILLSGGFGGLFFILAVLGEYIARILIEVRQRPFYSIRDAQVYVPNEPAGTPPDPVADELLLGRTRKIDAPR